MISGRYRGKYLFVFLMMLVDVYRLIEVYEKTDSPKKRRRIDDDDEVKLEIGKGDEYYVWNMCISFAEANSSFGYFRGGL